MEAPRFLTEREVANLTGIAAGTLRKGRSWGTLAMPFVKIGRSVRYDMDDVKAFMEARKVNPAAANSEQVAAGSEAPRRGRPPKSAERIQR